MRHARKLSLRDGPFRGGMGRPMHEWEPRSHVRWECEYHAAFAPMYLRKVPYGRLRRNVGEVLRDPCVRKGVTPVEGRPTPDHVHMCLPVPPKYSVAFVIGFPKGKSAIRIHRDLPRAGRTDGIASGRPGTA